jgi:hypothetical protein
VLGICGAAAIAAQEKLARVAEGVAHTVHGPQDRHATLVRGHQSDLIAGRDMIAKASQPFVEHVIG